MSQFLTCPSGHQWGPSVGESASEISPATVCPVCGAAGSLAAPDYPTGHYPGDELPPAPRPLPRAEAEPASTRHEDNTPAPAGGPAPDLPGYEILGELGRGAMGVVYKARQTALKRLVALKMLLTGAHAGPEQLARFRAEAETLARLHHPNIVQIHEVGEAEQRPYFALEYVEGGSLDRKLRGNPVAPKQAAQLVQTLAGAMAAAHQAGVIHRDLKPGNLLVDKGWVLKVTDFGLAKQLDTNALQTQTGVVMGTPSYMAPEQVAGSPKAVGPAADIWALGAILYELLTGRPPFKGASTWDTLQMVVGDEPVPPARLNPKVPRDLETICLKCLHKAPGRRFASAAELANDLGRFRRGEPVRARPVGHLERAWKWTLRHPTAAALIAAVVLLVFGGVAAGMWYVRDQAEQATRTQYVNKNLEAALDDAWRPLDEIDQCLANSLKTAELLSNPEQEWEGRLTRARQARDHAAVLAGNAREGLGSSLKMRLADLDRKLRLAEADWALAQALDRIRVKAGDLQEGKYDPRSAAPQYGAFFARELGLDFAGGNARELAARVAGNRLRHVFVAALDHWARLLPREAAVLPTVLEVARLADPDPWRDQVRDRQTWQDHARLKQLALQMDSTRHSPQVVLLLTSQLDDATRVQVLARALIGHPRDFWLHCHMARAIGDEGGNTGYYQAALAIRPKTAVVYFNLGVVLTTQGDLEGGIAAYRQAIACDPKSAEAHIGLGLALDQKKDAEGAIAAFRQAIACDPKEAKAHYNLGVTLGEKRDLEGAIAAYRQAIACDPKYASAHNSLGRVLYDKQDVEGAIAAYRQAIACDPKLTIAHNNLGLALLDKQDVEGAIAAYRQAIACDPKLAKAHTGLGLALGQKKDLEGAITAFRQAIACDPKLADAHYNLGVALGLKRELDGAITAYRQAIACDPKLADAHYNLGVALFDKQDVEGAIAAYLQAIACNPKLAKAHLNLGHALGQKKDLEGAIAAYRQAIACDPKDAIAHYNLGVALGLKKDLDGAIAAYRQAIACDPKFADAYFSLGVALRLRGLLKESVEALQQAARLLPKDGQVQQQLHYSQRWLEIESRLPDVLAGNAKLASAVESIEFAYFCQQPFQKRYAAALKLYKQAFAANPKFEVGYRYNAACAALLLAAGKDTKSIPSVKEAADLRTEAHQWLLADLVIIRKAAQSDQPATRKPALDRLAHWKGDSDLASVREDKELARLLEAERQAWQQFWTDVAALQAEECVPLKPCFPT